MSWFCPSLTCNVTNPNERTTKTRTLDDLKVRYQWVVQKQVNIYHLLRAAFGQCVTIAQIVHFDVSDIVTILLVDLLVKRAVAGWLRRRLGCART